MLEKSTMFEAGDLFFNYFPENRDFEVFYMYRILRIIKNQILFEKISFEIENQSVKEVAFNKLTISDKEFKTLIAAELDLQDFRKIVMIWFKYHYINRPQLVNMNEDEELLKILKEIVRKDRILRFVEK